MARNLERREAVKILIYGAIGFAACAKGPIPTTAYNRAPENPSMPPDPDPEILTNEALDQFTPTALPPKSTLVPSPRSQPEHSPKVEKFRRPQEVRGLHIPFHYLTYGTWKSLQELILSSNVNSLVVDIKNEAGNVILPFDHPLKIAGANYWENAPALQEFMDWANAHQIFPVARQVIGVDNKLAGNYFELSHPSGAIDIDQNRWINPARPEVADYNAAIARATALFGFNEILYDYVRYPETSSFIPFETRVSAIAGLLTAAKLALSDTPALLTAAVFGDTGSPAYTGNMADMGQGQHLPTMGQIADGICPMLYPDLRQENIAVDPYQYVYDRTRDTHHLLASSGSLAFVNPWIQAYAPLDNVHQIQAQMQGAIDAGSVGVFAWDPALSYPNGIYNY